jgi:hypothetical protein
VGFAYDIQTSTNLLDWTSITSLVTTKMAMRVMSLDAARVTQQYFRARR